MEVKSDNSQLEEKIILRLNSLEKIDKKEIRILECFAGDGVIWEKVKQRTDKTIKVLRIDIKEDKPGIYLKGNNLKFIGGFNLDTFDIIDLDAYGSPYDQLKIVFSKKYKGIVHCTFIQSGMGGLNHELLKEAGYTKAMIKKCVTMFNKPGFSVLCHYLALNGVTQIETVDIDRKHYFWFRLQ